MTNPLIPDVKYATLVTAGDGTKTEWEFNFAGGYISKDHVKAFTEDTVTGQITIRQIEFIGPNTVRITPAVSNGLRLVIYRDTPKTEPIVNYTDGSVMSETNLDKSNQQAVFIAAELADRVIADYDFSNSLLYAVETATAASVTANAAAVTANGIAGTANLALATSQSAVLLSEAAQVAIQGVVDGTTSITYTPSHIGQVPTKVDKFLNQWVTPEQFGATPTGDNTAAVLAAVATGKDVFFPRVYDVYDTPVRLTANDQMLYGPGGINHKSAGVSKVPADTSAYGASNNPAVWIIGDDCSVLFGHIGASWEAVQVAGRRALVGGVTMECLDTW